MTIRVRDKSRPGDASRDIDLGPHAGVVEPLPITAMRRPLDDAIVYAADHHRPIRVKR